MLLRSRENGPLPPGPSLPSALQTLLWIERPIPFLHQLRRRYGDVFTLRITRMGEFVYVASREGVAEIFRGDPSTLHSGAANWHLQPVLGERSVLLLDGEDHVRTRRMILPAFHGERIAAYAELMRDVVVRHAESWRPGETELVPAMRALTLEIILRAVIGIEDPRRLEHLRRLIRRRIEMSLTHLAFAPWDLGPRSPGGRFAAAKEELDALFIDEIGRRRADPDVSERGDVLSLLVEARDPAGEGFSDEELRDQLMTLLIAGHDSSAATLSWCFERLVRDPDVLRRLEAAVDGGDDGYVDATIQEAMRVRSVLPIVARKLTRDFPVAGHEVPAGAHVVAVMFMVHRDERVYPDPERFDPGRFVGDAPEPYSFVAFGGGSRRCLGAHFAWLELTTALREILRRWHPSVVDPEPEPIRRRGIVGTLTPGRGALVRLERR